MTSFAVSGILKAKQGFKRGVAAGAAAEPGKGVAGGASDMEAGEEVTDAEKADAEAGADEELGVDSELDEEERAALEAELDDAETVERKLKVEQEQAVKARLQQSMPWLHWGHAQQLPPAALAAGGLAGGNSRNPTHLSLAATSGAPDSSGGTFVSGSGAAIGIGPGPALGTGAAGAGPLQQSGDEQLQQLMPLSPMNTSEFDSYASLTRFPIGVGDSLVERCATELSMNAHVVRWARNEPIERIVQTEGTVRKLAAKKSECVPSRPIPSPTTVPYIC